MKNYHFKLLTVIIFSSMAIACNRNNPKGVDLALTNRGDSMQNKPVDTSNTSDFTIRRCYLATIGKDSAFLHFDGKDANKSNELTGTLHYKLQNSPEQIGSLTGEVHQDTVNLNYNYKEQGKIKSKELTFLIVNNQLIQGISDFEKRNGKVIIDKNIVDYTGKSYIFIPSECEKAEGKTKRDDGKIL